MSIEPLDLLDRPARVVVCGTSMCARALAHYLGEVADASASLVHVTFDDSGGEVSCPQSDADVLIVCASECSGRDAAEFTTIVERYPNVRLIAISPQSHASSLVAALDAGARGFIACGLDDVTDVVSALVRVLQGDIAFSNAVSRLIVTTLRESALGTARRGGGTDEGERLTERERGILRLLCDGLSNQQIAVRLSLSPNTVKNHLARLYRKLGVNSRGEAVSLAMRTGLA